MVKKKRGGYDKNNQSLPKFLQCDSGWRILMAVNNKTQKKMVFSRLSFASSVIYISAMNFLYYLLITKNLSYLYLDSVSLVGVHSVLVFIFILKIGFAGFFLGLLLSNWIIKKFPHLATKDILNYLSFIILSFFLVNYILFSNTWVIIVIAISLILIPALLFGLVIGILVNEINQSFHKILFYLLVGSTIAVAIYNYLIIYVPFLIVYLLLFFLLRISFLSKLTKPRIIIYILITAIFYFLLNRPNFGQVYTPPSWLKDVSFELISTKIGPYGVLDTLYLPDSDEYITLSDKESPSSVSIKGNIDKVQEHVKIPYSIKRYNNSLVIGIGGGQDLVAGLYYGTNKITAVEIDKQRVDLMLNEFGEYSNELFYDERINFVVENGRAFLRRNRKKYDLIVIQRPWTVKFTNNLFFDTSKELFTEEALDAYLNVLAENGIIFWSMWMNWEEGYIAKRDKETILLPLKNKLESISGNMLIFYPYENRNMTSIIISNGYNLEAFYSAYKDIYKFAYYPKMDIESESNEVVEYLFSKQSNKSVNIDKQFLGAFNRKLLNARIILIVALLLITTFFGVYGSITRKRAHDINNFLYLYLGIGYEIIALFLILWLSFFSPNVVRLLPIVLIVYFFLGSLGYLFAGKANRKSIFFISLLISLVFLFIWINNLFLSSADAESVNIWIVVLLFSLVSFLITFPFGFLINTEKNMGRALLIDYAGSVISFGVILAIPNLDYLLFLAIFIYLSVGLIILFKEKIVAVQS